MVRSLHILIVDDEPALGQVIAALLAPDGHTLTVVTSAEAALEHVATAAVPVDVVLTDLQLGAGLDGWGLAAQVRQRWPATRVVLVTGWGTQLDPEKLQAHGVVAVLAKPFGAAALQRVVARAGTLPG